MENKPVLFVLLSRFPYPLEKGDKLRAYYQLKDLSAQFDIVLCCTTETEVLPEHYKEVGQFCKEIHLFRLRKTGLLFSIIYAIFSGKPFQVAYFYRLRHHRRINRLLRSVKPDHIYCQLIRTTEYVKHYHHCAKTLDYMDALSKGMERRVEKEPWYKSWFYKAEGNRLLHYERKIFDYFEYKTIISSQDRQLILHPQRNTIHIVRNGVSESFFEELDRPKTYDILFTGNLSYPPNVTAAAYIAEEILPRLHAKGYKLNLLLSGSNPSSRVKTLQSEYIHVTGWVDDIRESYACSKIFIAPMFLGTGLQNKLLEAMAMGLPCITTTLANNALHAIDDENILLAEHSDQFVEKVIELLSNRDIFDRILGNARVFVRNNYSWHYQTEELSKLLHS